MVSQVSLRSARLLNALVQAEECCRGAGGPRGTTLVRAQGGFLSGWDAGSRASKHGDMS